MATTEPILEEGIMEDTAAPLQAREIKRPMTTEPGEKPSMLDALLKGHHRFDGTVWKQLCDSYNTQAQDTKRSMQEQQKALDREREKGRAKEALAEAIVDLRTQTSAHEGRRKKLAILLKENDETFRDRLTERRTRSQKAEKENPFAVQSFSQRAQTSGRVQSEVSEMSEEAERGFAAVARSTPWSEHRALTDRPTREDLVRRQNRYREMLDAQVADKRETQQRKTQADRDLEATTATSFYSPSHVWEERPWERYVDLDPTQYKHELLSAQANREKRQKAQLNNEREQYSLWVISEMKRSADTMARQEKKRLAMNENLVESWNTMCQRKMDKKNLQRKTELAQDKNLLGGTFRHAEEKVRLLRKPRPKFQY